MSGYRATGGMASRAVKTEHEGQHQEPQPEKVAGTVFPYRGVENHGVAPNQAPPAYIDDQWPEDTEAPHYEPGPTEDEPLPVRIVNEFTRELRILRPVPILVTDIPKPIVGRNEFRRELRIRNAATTISTTSSDVLGTNNVTTQTNLTTSGQTTEFDIAADGWTDLIFGLKITSLTGTTPGVTVKIQETINGTDWVDLVSFTAATGATYEIKKTAVSSNRIRVVWTTTGTVTDLDFTVDVMRFPVKRFTSTTEGGGNNVYVGENSVMPANGYLIPPGGELYPLTTEEEIWAVCDPGKTSTIYLLSEIVVPT